MKKRILILSAFGFWFTTSAYGVVFPDQVISATENSDDENRDSISSFGSSISRKKQNEAAVARPLAPISDSSFSESTSRAPASAGGRGPAAEVKPYVAAITKKATGVKKGEKIFQEIAVIANDLGFYPSTLFITQGIPGRLFITGASAKSQCFMLDTFGVRRQVRNQKVEEVTFTPDQSGTFTFSCPMNGAKGTVVVKELEVATRLPASEKKSEIAEDDFSPEFRNQ